MKIEKSIKNDKGKVPKIECIKIDKGTFRCNVKERKGLASVSRGSSVLVCFK